MEIIPCHAKFDFKKKPNDDRVRVQGKLELNLVKGEGATISKDVTIGVHPLFETITMVQKGKFDIRMDKVDLTGVPNSVTISTQIGDDFGDEIFLMNDKKHHWDYKAHRH